MNRPADRYPTRGDLVLVLNCGSSSIKFALFDAGQDPLPRQPAWNGKVHGIGGPSPTYGETGIEPAPVALDPERPYLSALQRIREGVVARLGGRRLAAIAHRVVHGGSRYFAPTRVDAAVLADLEGYIPLAPLHQPFALEAIAILLRERPDIPQVACFDTAFHHTLPDVEKLLPLPWDAWQRGLRRYGFHGLSYAWAADRTAELLGRPVAELDLVLAHLGGGASVCAVSGGRSLDTSMGFTPLDGLPMSRRSGGVDPGLLLWLLDGRLSLAEVSDGLQHESGLLGLSGGRSGDTRDLVAAERDGDEEAALALRVFCHRVSREIAAAATSLGRVDALVFTGEIGWDQPEVREAVCRRLRLLGVEPPVGGNRADDGLISPAGTAVPVLVVEPHEELQLARECLRELYGPAVEV